MTVWVRQKCVPCAVTTGLDIGLSNLSLKTITLSLYSTYYLCSFSCQSLNMPFFLRENLAMCKSSSLIFVLLFAFLFKLEKFSIRLVSVILLITAGVLLMVLSTDVEGHGGPSSPVPDVETDSVVGRSVIIARHLMTISSTAITSRVSHDLFPRLIPAHLKTPLFVGMLLVFSASAFGGLRWALTQLLLSGGHGGGIKSRTSKHSALRPSEDEKPNNMGLANPAATIFFLTPTMFISLLVVSWFVEGPLPSTLSESGFFEDFYGALRTIGFVLAPGVIAFAMVMSEY